MIPRLKSYLQAPKEIQRLRRQLSEAHEKLARQRAHIKHLEEPFAPGNIVWIFCAHRSGSTWLGSMMGDLGSHGTWKEPLVGELFGHLYYERATEAHRNNKNFILGSHREVWLRSVRSFVLAGAGGRFSALAEDGTLIIKEPHGSIGAPLLMEALPESRMVLLMRDPRDVAASALDASRRGSWSFEMRHSRGQVKQEVPADTVIKNQASTYIKYAGKAREAYEQHQGPKTLVRYEDLRANTLEEMRRLYRELGIKVDYEELKAVVEKHSWENIPEDEKGQGKFYRKASPGGWQEDLTPGQIETVESITAPLLEEFYPDDGNGETR